MKRIGIEKDAAAVGGVALNRGLVTILEKELGCGVLVPPNAQCVAALGAAIIAKEEMSGTGRQSNFKGFDLNHISYESHSFECKE